MTTSVTKVVERILRQEAPSPVWPTGVSSSTLIVTEPPKDPFVAQPTQVAHRTLLKEIDYAVGTTAATQSVLLSTEPPPGRLNVGVASTIQTTLLSETPGPTITGVHQNILVVTEPAQRSAVSSAQSTQRSIFVEQSGVVLVNKVLESTLLSVEAPIMGAMPTKIVHSTIVADLSRGELYMSGVDARTLLLTEAKSRDPHRTKSVVTASAVIKQYVDPAEVVVNYRGHRLIKSAVTNRLMTDPNDIPTSYREKIVTLATIVSSSYPERAISATNTLSVAHQAVSAIVSLDPSNLRSFTDVSTLEISTLSTTVLSDPQSIFATYQGSGLAILTAAPRLFDTATIQSSSTTRTVEITSLHAAQQFDVIGQSSTTTQANYVEVAVAATSYVDPNDPSLVSTVRTNLLHVDVLQTVEFVPPYEITSSCAEWQIALQSVSQRMYAAPQTVQSRTRDLTIRSEVASIANYEDPRGQYPSCLESQVAILHLCEAPDYGTLPKSPVTAHAILIQNASESHYVDPTVTLPSIQANQVGMLTVYSKEYQKPDAMKRKRRISSATVTRKDA